MSRESAKQWQRKRVNHRVLLGKFAKPGSKITICCFHRDCLGFANFPLALLPAQFTERLSREVIHSEALYELGRAGFVLDWRWVDSEANYLAHLNPAPALILADYSMPGFDGLRALRLRCGKKQKVANSPFA